ASAVGSTSRRGDRTRSTGVRCADGVAQCGPHGRGPLQGASGTAVGPTFRRRGDIVVGGGYGYNPSGLTDIAGKLRDGAKALADTAGSAPPSPDAGTSSAVVG